MAPGTIMPRFSAIELFWPRGSACIRYSENYLTQEQIKYADVEKGLRQKNPRFDFARGGGVGEGGGGGGGGGGKMTRIFINFQRLNSLCMQDRGFVSGNLRMSTCGDRRLA
ncbi:hypothetical protein M0802_009236 [Mischocyttarus mexicanus]|nr:hypothetical protein M0802_009236 [Mischocyttarus mexicanus]